MERHSSALTVQNDQGKKHLHEELVSIIIDKIRNDEVISILIKADDLNLLDSFGNTLLHIAAQYDNMVITQHLIQSECEINVQNSSGKTPLIAAIENRCQNSTNILLDGNANIFIFDNKGYSALDWVLYVDCFHTSQFFEKFLKKVESQCLSNSDEIANKLCDAGCILPWVVSLKNTEIIEKMLKNGCEVNAREPVSGHTALHKAVLLDDVKCVNLLLDYGAYSNTLDQFDLSSLVCVHEKKSFTSDTCANDRTEIVKMLIDRGVALDTPSTIENSSSQVVDVLKYGNKEAIEVLVQANLDLTKRDAERNTAVHILARNQNPEVFKPLEDQNFDVNARNASFETPLFYAATYGHAYTVEFLLKRGAEVNVLNVDHCSLLSACVEQISYAFESQYIKCVQLLLEYDADVQLDAFYDVRRKRTYFIGELLIAQLVLKEASGTPITELLRNQIYLHSPFKNYYNFSKQQLAIKFAESLTLFDLLRDSDDKFERHVRDRQVASNVLQFSNVWKSKSCYFNTVLQKRYAKAVHVSKLRKEAAILICKIMKTDYCRLPLIFDQIVDYLHESDLHNLLQVSL